jgi:hypothetical protein
MFVSCNFFYSHSASAPEWLAGFWFFPQNSVLADLWGFSRIEKENLRHNQRLWRLGILPILYVSEEEAALS